HGTDTLYRRNGSMFVGKFRKGKLKSRLADYSSVPSGLMKPEYPRIDLRYKQEEFLKELEIRWEQRNMNLIENAGFVPPKFQGGNVDDFALWVNSQVEAPRSFNSDEGPRTVFVEFTVNADGKLSEIHAVFGSNTELNDIAVKAVSKSPLWEPGTFGGEKKSTRLTVAVVFDGE
ncbi:MAG: energy transducer TonB, partial [Bacteroidales bacterium]|nr:energy transducer TonB [Bacteroidales bacterium]